MIERRNTVQNLDNCKRQEQNATPSGDQMKAIIKLFTSAILSLVLTIPSFAQIAVVDIEYDAADGTALEVAPQSLDELKASIEEKQQKTVALITEVAAVANSYASETSQQDEANYAYTGLVARLEGLRQEREELALNHIEADEAFLLNYSKRLDQLNTDLENFFR
jgi:hypothetical protein